MQQPNIQSIRMKMNEWGELKGRQPTNQLPSDEVCNYETAHEKFALIVFM